MVHLMQTLFLLKFDEMLEMVPALESQKTSPSDLSAQVQLTRTALAGPSQRWCAGLSQVAAVRIGLRGSSVRPVNSLTAQI